MSVERLTIPVIELNWSDWVPWPDLVKDARSPGGVFVPKKPGVYEVRRLPKHDRRLTIGKASNLRNRIKVGLVRGKGKHSTGKRIRAKEDTSVLQVRWAVTERPAAAEEHLHLKYKEGFDKLPKHVKNM